MGDAAKHTAGRRDGRLTVAVEHNPYGDVENVTIGVDYGESGWAEVIPADSLVAFAAHRHANPGSPLTFDDPGKKAATPKDSQDEHARRKGAPLARGLLDYFTAALFEVSRVSKSGNDQHNPGQDMHWARSKSTDHADCIMRHLADRGTLDSDGVRHTAKVAWRALALLQTELEAEGAPLSRASRP